MLYALQIHSIQIKNGSERDHTTTWKGIIVPSKVKLATDPRNPLREYY
jgi:hypothetical protein